MGRREKRPLLFSFPPSASPLYYGLRLPLPDASEWVKISSDPPLPTQPTRLAATNPTRRPPPLLPIHQLGAFFRRVKDALSRLFFTETGCTVYSGREGGAPILLLPLTENLPFKWRPGTKYLVSIQPQFVFSLSGGDYVAGSSGRALASVHCVASTVAVCQMRLRSPHDDPSATKKRKEKELLLERI